MPKKNTPTKRKKIDREIYEAGIKNGLSIKDIGFVGDILNGKTQSQAYKDNIAKQTTSDHAIRVRASNKLANDSVQKTVKEVMVNMNLTEKSIIQKHIEIQDLAIESKDYTNARETNRDFMKLAGMLDQKDAKESQNTYIQNNIIDIDAIDKLLALKSH